MKKQKNSVSVASRSDKKAKPFRRAIINVCGPSNSGKTTGIVNAARYFAKRYPQAEMDALQMRFYTRMKNSPRVECFEILNINGRRVGFYSKGDAPEQIYIALLLFFFFKCDIIVVASHRRGLLYKDLVAIAEFYNMTYIEIPTERKAPPYGTNTEKQIEKDVKAVAEVIS